MKIGFKPSLDGIAYGARNGDPPWRCLRFQARRHIHIVAVDIIALNDDVAKVKADPAHEVYTITDAQLGEWKKSAEPLEKQWSDNVRKAGGDPDAIMKELKASLGQYKAAY